MNQDRNKKLLLYIAGFLLVANALAWLAVFSFTHNGSLKVIFFDVGQGDSAFIETARGQQILIDGGPDEAILQKLSEEMPFWDKTIDLVLLSHPEADHLNGLVEVVRKYKVDNILWTGIKRDTALYREWLDVLGKENTNVVFAQAGQKIKMAGAELQILNPKESVLGQEFKESNDTSIVARLVLLGKERGEVLFTGDVSGKTEKDMLQRGVSVGSDILKVSHHGSKSASSDNFILAVSPRTAVISVGLNNRYSHPSKETLDTLGKYGINVLRTDINGDIKIILDGNNINFQNYGRK